MHVALTLFYCLRPANYRMVDTEPLTSTYLNAIIAYVNEEAWKDVSINQEKFVLTISYNKVCLNIFTDVKIIYFYV